MSAFIVAPEAEEDIFHVWLHLLREAGMQTASRIEGESGGTAAPRRRTTGNRRGAAWQTQRKALHAPALGRQHGPHQDKQQSSAQRRFRLYQPEAERGGP